MSDIDQLLNPARAPLHFKFDRNSADGPQLRSDDDNYSEPPFLFDISFSEGDIEMLRKHLAYAREHEVSVTIPMAYTKARFGTYEYETADPLGRRGEGDTPECIAVSISAYGLLQVEFSGRHTNVGYYATLAPSVLARPPAKTV